MSWNDYIVNLVGTGHVAKAAIVGLNGSVWAISSDFSITTSEIEALTKGWPNFAASGVTIGGTKFQFLRGDDSVVLAKLKATGVVIGKTSQAFVIGYHNENQQMGNCNNQVMKIVDHLSNSGY